MKSLAVVAFLLVAGVAFADPAVPPPPAPGTQPSDIATLQTQLSQIGCNAERLAAAQEISRLRAQVAELNSEKEKTAKK